ncbi:endosome-associated ubiquitin isopeptidase [Sporothrix brasiliensis 5110]|uniref:Endosome-associated ubiquitin isopeptidase n=1 Tax=Sporothrix brasiliensis 5110 TaxID=1398154 RepID=A0A0C2FS76_9PEZI|nr:endosome-associated ubiquitin isopeptidase [Sporothrix brasiliensis 5110]KIH93878.1 endosome-associated ubiquitin isopeptidase [Sporothrix brasiliensis 5110]
MPRSQYSSGSGSGSGPGRSTSSSSISISTSAYAPLSSKDLARSAEMFEWRPQIPLKFHIGSLDAMYREGRTYLAEHNYAKAFVLLMRFTIICVDKVPTHPEANTPEGRRMVRTVTRRLKTVMALLESTKEQLDVARQRWVDQHPQDEYERRLDRRESRVGKERKKTTTFAELDPALSWNPYAQAELLDAADHVELAIALANKRGQEGGSRGAKTHASTTPGKDTRRDAEDVSRAMERARWQLDEMSRPPPSYDDSHTANAGHSYRQPQDPVVPVSYSYPSIHKSTPVSYDSMRFDQRRDAATTSASGPPRPPKQPAAASLAPAARPPPVPSRGEPLSSRYNDDLVSLHQSSEPPSTASTPPPPPRLPPKTVELDSVEAAAQPGKTSQYTFKPAAYLESGAPIRSVFLPDTLRRDFLRVAQPNTDKGIETCGILCGKTANNALFITCLLIPQQIGTRDSCETTGEVATLEYCSEHDLIQIGWIHTHPTQTCFMSSLDMHTHAGYQIMMDESIAIVCAPAHEPSWGIFRLTNPPGLPYIGGCRKAGAFHEHDLRPHEIYTEAKNPPGHVFVVPGIDFAVADLREEK